MKHFSPEIKKYTKLNFILVFLSGLLFSVAGVGQTLIPNTTPVLQDFNSMGATLNLPTNWRMAQSAAPPIYSSAVTVVTQQASGGMPATGGTYNFGSTTTERAVGALTSGGFVSPNNLLGYFRNTNTSNLTQLTVAYDGERYRINIAAASIQFYYSLNGSTWTSVAAGDIAATSFPTGASTYTFTSGTVVNKTGIVISGLNIPPSSDFYLRWNINTTGANSQGIAVDNVSVTAAFAPAGVAPTVITDPVATSVTSTSASLSGEVVSDGGAVILGRGVVLAPTAINANPAIGGAGVTNVTAPGTIGSFTVSATLLPVNTQISYNAYGTNSVGTSYGSTATFFTLANTPTAPSVGSSTSTTLTVSIGSADGNPPSTEYAIQEAGSMNYVQADGSLGATVVWQTSSAWSATVVTGLASSTSYTFQVKARNGINIETTFGPSASGTTSAAGMQNQTITFGPLATQTYGDAAVQLTATASSGLTVTYASSDPSVATVSGDIVTITGAGSTIITASQAGDAMYNPAPDVTQTLTVSPKNLTVSGASADNKVYDGTTNATISGATLVGVVGVDDVTVSGGGTFATANAGTGIAVTAALVLGGADAANYTLTQPTGLSADITPAPQTITFNPLPNKTTADVPFQLTATTTSGLTITYTSSNPAVATVSDDIVSITGAGTTTITASQAGNGNYQAATPITQTLTVTLAPSVVTYNFGTAAGNAAPTGGVPVNNLTVSSISQVNNNGSTVLLSTTSPSSGYTGASGNYNAGAAAFTGALNTATSTYFQFTLTPAANYKVTLNSISFGSRSTATGPAAYTLRSSIDNYTANVATGTNPVNSTWGLRSPSTTAAVSGFGQAVTFRLYGHSGTGAASAGTANWRVDDVTLNLLVEAGIACTGTPVAGTASGDATFCVSGSTTLTLSGYTDPATASGISIQWYSSPDNVSFTAIPSATNPTLATGTVTQTTYYYATVTCSNSGLSATSNTVTVTINPNVNAGTVSGPTPVVAGSTAQYTTTGDAGGTWSSTNTAVATVDANTGLVTANAAGTTDITYTIGIGCGAPASAFQTLTVNANTFAITSSAGANGSISPLGVTNVTAGDDQTYTITANACYSIANVLVDGVSVGAVPTFTFTNVQASHTISATFVINTFTITATSGANGTVTPAGASTVACGANATYTITPATCYGVADVLVDGQSVGAVTTYTFTNVQTSHTISATFVATAPAATPVVTGITNVCPYIGTGQQITYTATSAGATSFQWTIPANTTAVGPTNGSSITLTFQTGFASQANKQLRVRGLSACGNSAQVIFYLVAQYPPTPQPITGPMNVCPILGTNNTYTYTIPPVTEATGYSWTAQAGTTIVTNNGTSATVQFLSGFTTSTITVAATNGCGTSGIRNLTVQRVNPGTPGPITGPTNSCPYIAPGGTPATYSIGDVPNAVSYTWTVPQGSIGLTGQGTTSISFTYPAGYTGGSISVTATNGCGTSNPRALSITKLNPAVPSGIDVIQTADCPDRVYTYSVAGLPANATSIQWTVPAGGTIISGQGTNSITVSYAGTSINGNVTAQALSNCGASSIRSTAVRLPGCVQERNFSKTTIAAPVEESLSVQVSPNPTTTDFQLKVTASGTERITVRILDMQGRVYRNFTGLANQSIRIGADLKAGAYILEVRQGNVVRTEKLLKF